MLLWPYEVGHQKRTGCHSLGSVFQLVCSAAGPITHKDGALPQPTRPPHSSNDPAQFVERSPRLVGPVTIQRGNSSFTPVVLASFMVDRGQDAGKLSGRWHLCVCVCVCVGSQAGSLT